MENIISVYEKDFTAEIVKITEKNNKFYIELDKTNFLSRNDIYGGDKGTISEIPLLSVIENDGVILHEVESKPLKIHKVKCSVDIPNRLNFLQQYFGMLLISELLREKYNVKVVKSYIDEQKSYIDIDRMLLPDDIHGLYELTDKLISDSYEIKLFTPAKAEFKKLKLKSIDKKLWGKVQLASIDDEYIFRCDMPTFNRTSELGAFSIDDTMKVGNGYRILFSFGKRAIDKYVGSFDKVSSICKILKCSENDIEKVISTLKEKSATLQSENASLRTEVSNYELKELIQSAEKHGDISIVKVLHKDVDMKYIELLSSRLVKEENVIVLFGIDNKDKTLMNFACSKNLTHYNMGEILKDAITLIDGNGGGSKFAAKGGGKSPNNLQSALDYAHKKVLSN